MFDLDRIRAHAKTVHAACQKAEARSLAVRYAWMVHRGLATMASGDERAAARYFALAAVLQAQLKERRVCPVHGEPRPCAECQGLARLHEQGEV